MCFHCAQPRLPKDLLPVALRAEPGWFTKPGLGWQRRVKAKGRNRSKHLDLALPRSVLGGGSPKVEGPYLASQSQWLTECRCRLWWPQSEVKGRMMCPVHCLCFQQHLSESLNSPEGWESVTPGQQHMCGSPIPQLRLKALNSPATTPPSSFYFLVVIQPTSNSRSQHSTFPQSTA